MEFVFDKFWKDDPGRTRVVSCGVVDLDRFGRVLDAHGIANGDRLLVAVAAELSNLIRKDRGFDVAARQEKNKMNAENLIICVGPSVRCLPAILLYYAIFFFFGAVVTGVFTVTVLAAVFLRLLLLLFRAAFAINVPSASV